MLLIVLGLPRAGAQESSHSIYLNTGRLDTAAPVALRQTAATASASPQLIQFTGPIQPEWYAALLQTGVRILHYVPENAYLVSGDAAALARAQSLPAVQWHGAFRAEHKVHPQARRGLTDEFVIQLVDDAAANAATLAMLDTFKLAPVRRQSKTAAYLNIVVRLPANALDPLASQPDVISIHPYRAPHKLDERQDQIIAGNLTADIPSGPGYLAWLATKGFTQAQFDASGFVVDISDSGIDNGTTQPGHFALYRLGATTQPSRVVYNRLEGTANTWRHTSTLAGCDGHGNLNTHIVAGYVDQPAGRPHTDASGFAYGLGVCPFVQVGSSVVFDPDASTDPDYRTLVSAAYRDGARISNNSWGSSDGVYDFDSQTFDTLVRDAQPVGSPQPIAGNQEMVIVFSAGNDGPDPSTVTSPGTAKNVITVGAATNVRSLTPANGGNDPSGADDCTTTDAEALSANDLASFSSQGPCSGSDGRIKPDLVAPGTHITGGAPQSSPAPAPAGQGLALSCFLNFSRLYGCSGFGVCALSSSCTTSANNFFPLGQEFYTESSGTSHAAPAVAGACALLRQYFINHALLPPSPAMTKAYLLNSARYLTGTGANDTLPSVSQGMGELNLGMAFDGTSRGLRDELAIDVFTASGQTRQFTGTIPDSTRPFRVTLAWTDAPSSTIASHALNNDLDLTVSIGTNTYRGNVFSGATSTTGGAADRLNNVESVFLPAGITGNFTVTVTAYNINSTGVPGSARPLNQDFALVVYNTSPLAAPNNGPVAATPVITPASGTLPDFVKVTLSCRTAKATLGYTLDGTEPTASSPVYRTALTLTNSLTFKAKAFKSGYNASATAAASYTITTPAITTPYQLPDGTVKLPYQRTSLQAIGGAAPYRWSVIAGGLPAGLKLSTSGVITGKAKTAGLATFTVQVTDAKKGTVQQEFSLQVN